MIKKRFLLSVSQILRGMLDSWTGICIKHSFDASQYHQVSSPQVIVSVENKEKKRINQESLLYWTYLHVDFVHVVKHIIVRDSILFAP